MCYNVDSVVHRDPAPCPSNESLADHLTPRSQRTGPTLTLSPTDVIWHYRKEPDFLHVLETPNFHNGFVSYNKTINDAPHFSPSDISLQRC